MLNSLLHLFNFSRPDWGLVDFLGILLLWTGYLDATKYRLESRKIRLIGTAQGHSRRFINRALLSDATRLFYLCFKPDVFLITVSIIALICMVELWWTIYIYYPYRMRGCSNFKRPNMWLYFVNSLLPNKIRKHL